jgi:hypothetical protein
MNWLRKIPGAHRSATGLEWVIWRKLPLILLVGTALLLLGLAVLHWQAEPSSAAAQRALQTADYMVIGALAFHWSAVVTVGIGCVIVMVMKGPAYAADSYPVSHSDRPLQSDRTDGDETTRDVPPSQPPQV